MRLSQVPSLSKNETQEWLLLHKKIGNGTGDGQEGLIQSSIS